MYVDRTKLNCSSATKGKRINQPYVDQLLYSLM